MGHVFWYTIEGKGYDLEQLRALQDWQLRYQLETVPGVAEVASIGGFVRQYQVNLDPAKLFSYGISASTVIDRVRQSTNEVGGDVLEMSGAEYMIRGLGYLKQLSDLENIPVATKNGTPVLVRESWHRLLRSRHPPRRSRLAGRGETVGGIVVMRYGQNALNVINGVKARFREIGPSLPPGVEIVSGYDRSWLINDPSTPSSATSSSKPSSSASSPRLPLPFPSALVHHPHRAHRRPRRLHPHGLPRVSSNIMSLGGIALAIGVLIDAAIVMVENGYRHLAERTEAPRE